MKSKILFLLLCVFSLGVMGQNENGKDGKTQGLIKRNKPKTEGSTGGQDKKNSKKQTSSSNSNKTRTQSATVSQGVQYGSHYYVDLGLPSGTKWATTNVGAYSPSDYGDYFAWGETSTKSSYDWSNLKYCLDSTGGKFSKYVTDSKYGNVDGKSELDLSDDAAYVNWGSGWRMPLKTQQDELREKCTWTWMSMGGHNGYKVVGPNGNSLFLPAAGYRFGSGSNDVGSYGDYWSRTLSTSIGFSVYELRFFSSDVAWIYGHRRFGCPVRAVRGSE